MDKSWTKYLLQLFCLGKQPFWTYVKKTKRNCTKKSNKIFDAIYQTIYFQLLNVTCSQLISQVFG